MKEASRNSLFRFIKTFVIHLTAKRFLEKRAFMMKDKEVEITLFTVDRSALCIPAGSWQKMEGIVRESFTSDSDPSSTPGDTDPATEALKMLKRKIETTPSNSSKRTRGLLDKFRLIIAGDRVLFHGGLHCETVLATLKKFFEASENRDVTFMETCKVLQVLYTYLPA
jgi:hypothetical protein